MKSRRQLEGLLEDMQAAIVERNLIHYHGDRAPEEYCLDCRKWTSRVGEGEHDGHEKIYSDFERDDLEAWEECLKHILGEKNG